MKSCPAAGYQVDDAAERLGDTRPNPHGGEDDLSSNQTAAILQNTSADIAADLRGRFTLFLLSPLFRNRASDSFSAPSWLSSPAAKPASFSFPSKEKRRTSRLQTLIPYQTPFPQTPVSRIQKLDPSSGTGPVAPSCRTGLLLLLVQREKKNLQVADADTLPNSFTPDIRLQDSEA